ncbi:DUF1330 domain-containing protein [Methylobacterium sp. CB376]|uniref:DUF1330 domain-containing protein n=1 Tax=unclassified Methylobacterium TaxID=2615210 RepID=UPI00223EA1D0|nr:MULTISPECIES: DUF1330 domain-containing protein [Methylobacterium]WFT83096.1 DUF1330 domain-containing protein [Methylobacterium nodulans]
MPRPGPACGGATRAPDATGPSPRPRARPDAAAAEPHRRRRAPSYARRSAPAIAAAGGRILARGLPAQVCEAGLPQRTVLIESDSVEQARAAHDSPAHDSPAHDSPAYQEALALLAGSAERDIRIVEGV